MREKRPSPGEPIEVRCLHFQFSEPAQRAKRLIIGKEEEEIGPDLSGGRDPVCPEQARSKQVEQKATEKYA